MAILKLFAQRFQSRKLNFLTIYVQKFFIEITSQGQKMHIGRPKAYFNYKFRPKVTQNHDKTALNKTHDTPHDHKFQKVY